MDIRAWFGEYMTAHAPCGTWTAEVDCAVRACAAAYRRTGGAAYQAYMTGWADALIAADACAPGCWRALFAALAATGEAKYREAIETVMTRLGRQPSEASMSAEAACAELPFRMAYEMQLGGMEKVGLVAAAFRRAHSEMRNARTGLYGDLRRTARILLALTDAIDACADQLYEHWRAMVDIYRETLKAALAASAEMGETEAMLLHALHEGVRMGLIDPERYLPVAKKRIAALSAAGHEAAAAMLELEGGAW